MMAPALAILTADLTTMGRAGVTSENFAQASSPHRFLQELNNLSEPSRRAHDQTIA